MTPEDRVHAALHKLWTAAVGTPGYNKADWNELAYAISSALTAERQSANNWMARVYEADVDALKEKERAEALQAQLSKVTA